MNFILDYVIVSCLFNLVYYSFDLETYICNYVKSIQDVMMKEMERRDPFHPFLKNLKNRPDILEVRKELDKFPIQKLIRDLIFFPINFIILCCIMFDKMIKK